MGVEVLKSSNALQEELEKAKSNLKGLNDNIRRIVGREPQDTYLRGDRKRNYSDNRRNDFNNSDRQRNRDISPPLPKRRQTEARSVFSRLSGPHSREDESKPKIHSRVIRELPTRQEIVDAQGTDEQSKARNKRMFGCLLGTLQKFCQEESRLKEKEKMKAEIEKKLEVQEQQERENLKRERQLLFSDRRRQQLEIRMLEAKMVCLKEFESWEKSRKLMMNFIRLKTKPYVYFRPKKMNQKCEKKLLESNAELKKEIEKRRAEVNEEILAIEAQFKARMEHIGDRSMYKTLSKHDRRHNDEEEDDQDSLNEHSDEDNFENEQMPTKYERNDSETQENKNEQHEATIKEEVEKSNYVNPTDKKENEKL